MNKNLYDESTIKTLDWKDHIRSRPGMYIGKVGDGSKSQFVRVYTTFGICGASFQQSGGFWSYKPESPGGCTTR